MLLRHVSWVVDVRRGAAGSWLDYGCFQLFYPCCYGATERFADFRARNPDPGAHVDEGRLARTALRGAVYSAVWLAFPAWVDLASLLTVPRRLGFVAAYLLVFVRTAVFLMAVWSTLEAMALCWGMRIHPNFAGILAARNPSEFWYAWRGTMTRWLVEYVYVPLGGNRAHRTRNVFAVFAVSAAWHALGVPFLEPTRLGAALAPIGVWALVNAVVLSITLAWRGRAGASAPARTPLRTGLARIGTWMFGGVTATVLAFQSGDLVVHFPALLARLAGLR
jgi:alginate O-acetyltransferase complex protein AlgI